MSKIKILFLAADPLSSLANGGRPPLQLAENARQIQDKVATARYGNYVDVDDWWAVRTSDLQRSLIKVRPRILHFSGHGTSEGLVFLGPDGSTPHHVSGANLGRLLDGFRDEIRLVVLSACYSHDQAQAISEVVGCAIGTHGPIGDDAAITFDSALYHALASGYSVLAAYKMACAMIGIEQPSDREDPQLLVRRDVDPARLILIPSQRPAARVPLQWLRLRWTWLFLAAVIALTAYAASTLAFEWMEALAISLVPLLPVYPLLRNEQRSRRVRRTLVGSSLLVGAAAVLYLFDGVSFTSQPASANNAPPPAILCPATPAYRNRESAADEMSAPIGTTEFETARALFDDGNYAMAYPLLLRATADSEPGAQAYLGLSIMCGLGTTGSPEVGANLIREAASRERDPHAMVLTALAYEMGEGLKQSSRYAIHWFVNGAESGNAEAIRHLGRLALAGDSADTATARFRRAAEAGSLDAIVDLGYVYEQGFSQVPRDMSEARRLYLEAAGKGAARGMLALGRIYKASGDLRAARSWYEKAAEKGSADAMNNLGVLYQVAERGDGVRRSRLMAQRWYRRAADAGSTEAAANLAAMRRG